jgi:hypothetical protein
MQHLHIEKRRAIGNADRRLLIHLFRLLDSQYDGVRKD